MQIQNFLCSWADEIGTVNHVEHHMQKTFVNKSVVFLNISEQSSVTMFETWQREYFLFCWLMNCAKPPWSFLLRFFFVVVAFYPFFFL